MRRLPYVEEETATNGSPKFTRRQFLGQSAAAVVGSSLPGAGEDPYALRRPPVPGAAKWRLFQERVVSSACGQCGAGCGIAVRVVEGRAVKIAGKQKNPINEGGIGPRGLAGLEVLYDPDRIRQPLRRKGARGSGRWEEISWDDALIELTTRLAQLRKNRESHKLAVVCGRERGMMRDLWKRFATTYGTPNFFDGSSRNSAAVRLACYAMQGVREIPAYDWRSTRYIISLGSAILEASCQAIYFSRAASYLRRGRALGRAKIVHVGPSYSRTAAGADEWISIKPGTYAAFTLGLAHVLIRDNLYDREFVERHCFGFDEWEDDEGTRQRGFRDLVLADYVPERVGQICGVATPTIERIARELAQQRPGFAITDDRATYAANGLHTAMAVYALNALLGAIDRPGGVLTQRSAPLTPWPHVDPDTVATAALRKPRVDGVGNGHYPLAASVVEALPDALLSGKPYPIDTVLLYYANPCYAWTNPRRWIKALTEVPFVVTFSPFLDETAATVADLILPDHTYLERWEDAASAPSVGYEVFGVRRPVVEPLYDTRATGDVVIEIAKGMENGIAAAFPWKDFRAALLARARGIKEAGRGTIIESSTKKFFSRLFNDGVWTEPAYPFEGWEDVARTPSGKIEFFSLRMRQALKDAAVKAGTTPVRLLASWGRYEEAELACMPHYQATQWAGQEGEYPLFLEPYRPGTYAEGGGANLPLLQELVTIPDGRAWQPSAEIHPRTARSLGIEDGERVAVESLAGRVEVRIHVRSGVRQGVLRFPQGGGHTAFGRFAIGKGANVIDLLVPAFDPFGGFASLHGTRVRIERLAS